MASKSDGDDKDAKDGEKEGKAKGGKGKLIIMLLPTVLLLAGAVWFFFLRSTAPPGPVKVPPPVPGPIVKVDPITINLAGGHFLKIGLALQPTLAAGEEVTGEKALDLAISEFSGMTVDELSSKTGREKAKTELIKECSEAYEKKVYDIYFTEFVMQ